MNKLKLILKYGTRRAAATTRITARIIWKIYAPLLAIHEKRVSFSIIRQIALCNLDTMQKVSLND